MHGSEVYITIGLDKNGDVVEVRLKGGDAIRPKDSPSGPLEKGREAPGCEKVLKILVHELLTCGTKKADDPGIATVTGSGSGMKSNGGSDSGGGTESSGGSDSGGGTGGGTDPCCYRDPATGRIWCWC